MKKLLLSALAGLSLFAAQAGAATYYIKPQQGNAKDTNAGSASLPWKTFNGAKAVVLPGDIVYCFPGLYSTFPNPDSAGSNPTNNGYITFIGVGTTADALTDSVARDAIRINAEGPAGEHLVLKGFRITASLHFGESSDRDSIMRCNVAGDLEMYGGDYNVVQECSFTGTRIAISRVDQTASVGNVVRNNFFWKIGQGVTGTGDHLIRFGNNPDSGRLAGWCDSLQFIRNKIFGRLESNVVDLQPMYVYRTRRSNIDYNRFQWNLLTPKTHHATVIRLRDSTYSNTFNADTILATGTSGASCMWSSSGGNVDNLKVFGNVIDSCVINLSGVTGDYSKPGYFYDELNNWTITNSLFAGNGSALWADICKGRNTISRNTFVGGEADGVINLTRRPGTPAWGDTTIALLGNSIGTFSPPYYGPLPGTQTPGSTAGLVLLESSTFDSATVMRQQDNLLMNNNSYGGFSGTAPNFGDRCILIKNGANWLASTPGDSLQAWGDVRGLAENRWRLDSLGTRGTQAYDYGGPDSTAGPNFNPALGDNSAGDCVAGIPQATCEFPRIRVYPQVVTFFYGSAGTYSITVSNIGRGAESSGVETISTGLPGGVTVTDTPTANSLGEGGLEDVGTFSYDGTSLPGEGYFYIETTDKTVPVGLRPGSPTSRYIPIFVKIFGQ